MTMYGYDYSGSFYFVVDDARFAFVKEYSPDNDFSPQGSATINMELTAGQIVWIENAVSTTIYGTNDGRLFSWFTGHLLYTL